MAGCAPWDSVGRPAGDPEPLWEDYRELVEQMPGAVCRFDVDRRVMLYVSPQIELLTGRPATAWVGSEGYARWSASMVDPAEPDWESLARRGVSWQNRYRWQRADGEWRWFRSIARMVAPGIAQAVVFDVTEDVENEQRLGFERIRYQALIEQMPVVTILADADGVVEYLSPQAEEMFGAPIPELIPLLNSERWLDSVHPDDRDRVARFYAHAPGADWHTRELELRAARIQTGYRELLVRRTRVEVPAPAPPRHYYQSVVIDITELRAAQARSRAAVAALVRAGEEERGRLAVELHDDTVQAMTAVLLQLQRVRQGHANSDRGDRDARRRDRPHAPLDVRGPPGPTRTGRTGGDDHPDRK